MSSRKKLTEREESYVHYVECIQCLNNAWAYLQEIRSTEQKSAVTAAAYRFALIEYSKPYTASEGFHRNRKRRASYRLQTPDLSDEDLRLHKEILTLRDKVLAHHDLNLMEAQVFVPPYPGKPGYSANIPPSLPTINDVIALIERTLDKMYPERAQLEKALTQGVELG